MYHNNHPCELACCRYRQASFRAYPCYHCGGRGYTSNYDGLPPGAYCLVEVKTSCYHCASEQNATSYGSVISNTTTGTNYTFAPTVYFFDPTKRKVW